MPKPTSPFAATKKLVAALKNGGTPISRTLVSHTDGVFVPRGQPNPISRAWREAGAAASHADTGVSRAAAAFAPGTSSGALGQAMVEYRANRSALRGLKTAGVAADTIAAYRKDMTPEYNKTRQAAVKGLLGDLRSGRGVPLAAEKFLRKSFESMDAYVARRLRRLEARIDATISYLSAMPGRGADGQFKSGSALTGKMIRQAYAPYSGKEVLRKAVAAVSKAKGRSPK